jgi:hypothetical protein
MRLNMAKRQERNGVKFFYVTSDSEVDKTYIVVKVDSKYFCQCSDFFARKLPHLGTNTFSLCKHGQFARTEEFTQKAPKRFQIWTVPGPHFFAHFQSSIANYKTFSVRSAAQKVIDREILPERRAGYQVKEVD